MKTSLPEPPSYTTFVTIFGKNSEFFEWIWNGENWTNIYREKLSNTIVDADLKLELFSHVIIRHLWTLKGDCLISGNTHTKWNGCRFNREHILIGCHFCIGIHIGINCNKWQG